MTFAGIFFRVDKPGGFQRIELPLLDLIEEDLEFLEVGSELLHVYGHEITFSQNKGFFW